MKKKLSTVKVDLQELARTVCEFGGMKPSQAPGLAVLFGIVERAAFCDAIRIARTDYFSRDPDQMYRDYAEGVADVPDEPSAVEGAGVSDIPEVQVPEAVESSF